ncbi:ArsC family reductase [Lutibaculum baratangense]|uniref:A glutathione-dependent thiol reductase n=1 Tax=Lutibaculum baratangense AMV1 TaxID=631454 RepID=V4RDJ5_9HYPH|nr:ArsC family reductase [Lutibaculum baratangense]ESR23434.1 a glutathione-dependent thiol reductase [Lutibaculum baratangense AMV1]
MGSVTIYGIKNCDTMKKARHWLEARGIGYVFHDYTVAGLAPETLDGWLVQTGWETLLNRSGTTFRKLPDEEKAALDQDRARRLMLAQPSMVKRPVLEVEGRGLLVGFRPESYDAFFAGTGT